MKNYVYILGSILVGFTSQTTLGQQTLKLGINPTTVTSSAVLDLEANDKGALLPRIGLTSVIDLVTIPNPANGLIIFNTALAGLSPNNVSPGYYYFESASSRWKRLLNNTDLAVDLRMVGNNNHVSNDAGVFSNGTSLGTGSGNIAIGKNAMSSISDGISNLALGADALKKNTTGNYNLAIGESALLNNTTARSNIAFGVNALYANTTGEQNVAIGSTALTSNTTGSDNVALGFQTLISSNGSSNVGIGSFSLFNNTIGATNIAIGKNALSDNTAGNSNVAIGIEALKSNTTANYNIAIGANSLRSNTAGAENIGIGGSTLFANTTGEYNIAIGSGVLNNNTTGRNNFGLGNQTLSLVTTGSNNIAIGNSSGYELGKTSNSISTGSNNFLVGSGTLVPDGTASNQMNIKNTIFGTGMNGSLTSPAGSIGINVSAPSNALHVKATSDPLRLEGLQTGSNADNLLTADATGVVKQINVNTLRWFYMPRITIETNTVATGQTKDLYNLYKNQFSSPAVKSPGAPTSLPFFASATDLYYFVTSYDTNVLANISIDANGIMTYDVISPTSSTSVLNIVLMLK